jgi:hypothetical protein
MPTPNPNYDPSAADPKKSKAKRKNDRKGQGSAALDAAVLLNDE